MKWLERVLADEVERGRVHADVNGNRIVVDAFDSVVVAALRGRCFAGMRSALERRFGSGRTSSGKAAAEP